MADHNVDICNDWNGVKGDKVTFINNTQANCKITQSGTVWPFRDGPPIPASGSIAPGKTASTHLKNDLPDNKYPYVVDCCKDKTPKYVTVP
jgi:hypothetical protein